jgi:hypothetical protein
MSMIVGDALANTGLAGAMYSALLAADTQLATDIAGNATLKAKISKMCNGLAAGLVPYIQTNAQVIVPIGTGIAALQSYDPGSGAVPTTAPLVATAISGTVT